MVEEEEGGELGVGLVLGLMDGEKDGDVSRAGDREEDVDEHRWGGRERMREGR